MTTIEKVTNLLARNFLVIANWQRQDRQVVDVDADENLTLLDADSISQLVPFDEVTDIGFASRLVPERYLPINDYEADLSSRFAVFCQLTDLNDDTASQLLGRSVRLEDLREPDDWKTVCTGLIGL